MTSTGNNKTRHIAVWEALAFVLIIAIIGVNTYLAFNTIGDLSQRHRSVTNTGNIIVALKDLRYALAAAESGKRGYLLTGEDEFLEPYHNALSELDMRIAAVRAISTEIPYQADRITDLLTLVEQKIADITRVVHLSIENKDRRAMKIIMSGQDRDLYTNISRMFEDIESQEFAMQSHLYSQLGVAEKKSNIIFMVFLLTSSFLLIGLLILQKKYRAREAKHTEALEQRAQELEAKVAERTQELSLYAEELSRSNQELEDFAFVASHDLQEPLRKIRAFADRILTRYKGNIDDKGVDYLKRLNNAAIRMSTLIHDLLEFSRIKTRGKEFTPVDLNDVVNTAIDDLTIAIEESGAVIHNVELPSIEADLSQMRQVFLNILSNAIKFHKPELAPEITLQYCTSTLPVNEVDVDYHDIRIKDNGVGFDQSYADKVFIPFQRLHSRDEYKGNGIGLAVCRRIIERHGGTIRVQSTLGEGTEFKILLPLKTINFHQPSEIE